MKLFTKTLKIILVVSFFIWAFNQPTLTYSQQAAGFRFWQVQSIDTMKYSRDTARQMLSRPEFDAVIDLQVRLIAETGATHVAIATPYDEEFLPFLARWVSAARRYGLNVWFRGNFSGWEGWFSYPRITRTEHMLKTEEFILNNSFFFEDGDVFTACPECENGGPGDPRHNGDLSGHREFLIAEYGIVKNDFRIIGKQVAANYHSMNGDVARLVMDKPTTAALGGVVTVDHYVATTDKLVADLRAIADKSGGRIVLGEYGHPIPDIHGSVSGAQQAEWLSDLYSKLIEVPEVIGLNYWTNIGGSTELWNSSGAPRPAVDVVKKYYTPPVVTGYVKDELERPVEQVTVKNEYAETQSNTEGYFEIPVPDEKKSQIFFDAPGFETQLVAWEGSSSAERLEVALQKQEKNWLFRILEAIKNFFRKLVPLN